MVRTILYCTTLAIIFTLIGWFLNVAYNLPRNSNPIAQVKPTPLLKYTIENLSKTNVEPVQIQIGDIIKVFPTFTSYKFYINFDPTLTNGPTKRVSGVINIPNDSSVSSKQLPVILMLRGYIDPKNYFPGEGSQASSQVFANNGFITIAPDFLGYGESDKEPDDVFEARFQTYTTAMVLLKSIKALKDVPLKVGSNDINVNTNNIFIWGHSNGGQIALTLLEITGTEDPTVLWAPVSMPFPGSILFYAYEADDQGKYLVSALDKFNGIYDASKYSLTNYLSNIKAPIQLNQGTNDIEVPSFITDDFDTKLKDATVSATYIKYAGNDHNMLPDWNSVIQNSLSFYQKHLK